MASNEIWPVFVILQKIIKRLSKNSTKNVA